MITSGRGRTAVFAFGSLAIVACAMVAFRSAVYAEHPDVLAWGFTFDLTLTIPLLYFLLVVRSGVASRSSAVIVFVVCLAVAARIVPHDQQQFLHQLRFIGAPLDVVSMWLVARRLARGRGTGNGIVDRVVASELAMVRYGLLSWRKRDVPGFTVHKRNDWATVAVCLAVAIVAESIGVHLLIQHWSARVAWIVTALDLYGILWIAGDYHALRLLPTTIENGRLHLRYGMRWRADVDASNIRAIRPAGTDWKRTGVLKVAMLDEPAFVVELHEPVIAHGLAGIRRTIDAIAILPDEPERFREQLHAALSSER